MVQLFKKVFIIIFIFSIALISFNNTFWANIQKFQYTFLNPQSQKSDVIKFQKFFKVLRIYSGNIDGKHSSIKPDIITFQVKNKIIKSKTEKWAGNIWPKTFNYFENKYPIKFRNAYLKFFPKEKAETIFKNETCFIITAYYSPLPNQKRYATKSYARDIRLNWNGTHWASWVRVHPGFIAAPSNYPFGTKIQLEWLWVWVVQDRWGAIVRKWVRWHKCDRLDIWMWYGDEWLNRALKWWKKEVKWKIVDKNTKITITFPTEIKEYLAIKIKPESNKSDLKKMQKLFKEARLYNWKIDWKYSSFKKSIIDFQIKNKIIANKNDYGAGYIWNKTIKKLEEKHPKVFIIIRRENWNNLPEIIINTNENIKLTQIQKEKLNKIKNKLIEKIKIKANNKESEIKIIIIKTKEKLIKKMNNSKSKLEKLQLNYLINILK